jgi:hypothetical protein
MCHILIDTPKSQTFLVDWIALQTLCLSYFYSFPLREGFTQFVFQKAQLQELRGRVLEECT